MPEPPNISGEEWRLRELVSEAEVQLGPKHPEVALRLMNLGSHLVHQNRLEDARECYKRAVELFENRRDEFQAELADACFGLSSCYSQLCEWDEAFPWLERALAICRTARGMDDESTFAMELEVIILVNRRGGCAEATALARPLLEKAERLFGREAPRTARVLFELATALVGDEQHGEAEPLFRRVLLADEKRLGPTHPELITDLDWLGGTQHELGRYEEAEMAYLRAIQIGSSYPDRYMAAPFSNYSLLLLDMGKLEEAEAYARRSLEAQREASGSNSLALCTRLRGLADVLKSRGKLAEAESALRWLLSLASDASGPSSPTTILAWDKLASFLKDTGRLTEAEEVCRDALKICHSGPPLLKSLACLFEGKLKQLAAGRSGSRGS
jgi:tetratricopeptide (TPR) repeat protein